MPIIDITLLEGRDMATKKQLMLEVTDLIEARLEVPRDSIRVAIREIPTAHFAVGGVPKDELDAADERRA